MAHVTPGAGELCWRRVLGRARLHLHQCSWRRDPFKYHLTPEAGDLGLTPDDAKAKGPDFYPDELKDRLAKGPVVFDLVAIMGKPGDQTSDPTLRWDDEDNRPTTSLGKISIEAIVPDATCDAGTFLPGNVTDGVAGPTNDPIFAARSPAYIVSFTRRKTP